MNSMIVHLDEVGKDASFSEVKDYTAALKKLGNKYEITTVSVVGGKREEEGIFGYSEISFVSKKTK